MKEDLKGEITDHVQSFKVVSDGWHVIRFEQGIDLAINRETGAVAVDKNGNHSLLLPYTINDADDADNGSKLTERLNFGFNGPKLAGILACAGLWEAVKKRFPGPDVSVFDQPVVDGIKAKLPGLGCMVRTAIDKDGYPKSAEWASFAHYKKLQAEEKTKAATSKKGKAAAPAETTPAAETAPAGDGW
jgi:hypothetical protein